MKIPFLHNVRRGLATNSSSSHSLVFHAQPVASDDISSAAYTDTEFGWDHFVLDSLGEKLMYALTNYIGNGWRKDPIMPDEIKQLREQYGHLFPELDKDEYWISAINGYVDHQSRSYQDLSLVEKVRDPHVIIHGGNDNGGYPDIEYGWDIEAMEETETNNDLSEGARREMLG